MADPRAATAATYDAASDHYDAEPLSFWVRYGERTVDRLGLSAGASVLGVCCGSGASAVPAAEHVGPGGRVLAVDLADRLLELGRAKASARGLGQVEFRRADAEALELPAGSFDAVVCVFGIFFSDEMAPQVARLWQLVGPGGQLAITTWGHDVFEPLDSAFWDAVRAERPELYRGFNPWERLPTPGAVGDLLAEAGVPAAEVAAEPGVQPVRSPEDGWAVVLGTGYRGTFDRLGPDAQQRVRTSVLAALDGVDAIQTNVVYASARKR
jgi:SAM-dependent methyltransferase